jgi:peptidoglycan/LPS O-acetylase OafA/YrhL
LTPPTSARFFSSLEALRGIAALTVALYHVSWQNHLTHGGFIRNGYLMVDFFFVLSGFVMMHSYGNRLGTLSEFERFVRLRLGRLYPLHLATLLAFLVIEIVKWTVVHFHLTVIATQPFSQNTPGSFLGNLLLIHSLGFWKQPTWNVPSWSISTEFYTYLVFALICRTTCGTTFRTTRVLPFAVPLALGGFAISAHYVGDLTGTAQFGLARCWMGFFCGVVTWHIYHWTRRPSPAWVQGILYALSVTFLIVKNPGASDFLTIPLFMAVILAASLGNHTAPRSLVWLGAVSYSIYMVHPLIMWCFEFVLQYVLRLPRESEYLTGVWRGDVLVVLYVGLLLAISRWTFIHIEDRFRRWIAAGRAN